MLIGPLSWCPSVLETLHFSFFSLRPYPLTCIFPTVRLEVFIVVKKITDISVIEKDMSISVGEKFKVFFWCQKK